MVAREYASERQAEEGVSGTLFHLKCDTMAVVGNEHDTRVNAQQIQLDLTFQSSLKQFNFSIGLLSVT